MIEKQLKPYEYSEDRKRAMREKEQRKIEKQRRETNQAQLNQF